MSDELSTQERLARLRLAFPSDQALADWISCHQDTIHAIVNGKRAAGADLAHKVQKRYEQVRREHQAGLDALSYTIQTMEWLRQSVLTEEQQERHSEKLSRIDRILQQKADEVQTAYA